MTSKIKTTLKIKTTWKIKTMLRMKTTAKMRTTTKWRQQQKWRWPQEWRKAEKCRQHENEDLTYDIIYETKYDMILSDMQKVYLLLRPKLWIVNNFHKNSTKKVTI